MWMKEIFTRERYRYTGDEYTPNTASELYTPDSERLRLVGVVGEVSPSSAAPFRRGWEPTRLVDGGASPPCWSASCPLHAARSARRTCGIATGA